MEEIGATPYFSPALAARLRESMKSNAMTPTVVHQEFKELITERDNFVERLRQLKDSLETLGFGEYELEEGESEIGFQIPRSLFNNELEGFSKELHELRLIIRAFSEVAKQPGEKLEVRLISTTDPLIFSAVSIYTARQIAKAVEWCLQQWKTVEEIKVARATTASLKVPSAEAMVAQFDQMIEEAIQRNTRAQAERLAAEAGADAGRQNELANHVGKALEGLLARIERGMTVELRLSSPAEPKAGEEETPEAILLRAQFEEVSEIRQNLVFPKVSEEPVLRLEKLPENKGRTRPSRQPGAQVR